MSSYFHQLSYPALNNLAIALESGRLLTPFLPIHLTSYVPSSLCDEVAKELNKLSSLSMTEVHIAYTLKLLAEERASAQTVNDKIDLVWTGEDFLGSQNRDTSVVVRELFQAAQHSVLIATYVFDKSRKTQEIFQVLGDRMDTNPHLQVQLFVNISRPYGSKTSNASLLRDFVHDFYTQIWSGKRSPQIFYYQRSLSTQIGSKSCLHAKCVVIDKTKTLVTSANFTEAAHERNLETGVLIVDPVIASRMVRQFETLVERNLFRKLL